MADWDERDLEQSEDEYVPPAPLPPDEPRSPVTWPLIVAAALALVAGLGLYWLFSDRSPVTVPEREIAGERPAPAEPEPVPMAEPEPETPEVDLPPLGESDAFLREVLSKLSRHPAIVSLLITDDLMRKLVAAVVNVAEGDNPARHFSYLSPDQRFDVVQRPPRVFVDPRSYHRYDALAEGFDSLDVEGLAALYRDTKPLAEEAYRELGYLDEPFEATLAKAFRILLETPVVEGRISLEAESVNYTITDRRLEALSPAQKQLVRMGPENTRKIQRQLRELAEALGIPTDS